MKLSPPLDRRFRLIAFDWDDVVLANRPEDAAPVRGPIDRLLRCGVLVVVIAATHIRDIDGQLSRSIRGGHKRNLYLATERGAEVYGFDERFEPELLWARPAGTDEPRAPTAVEDAVRWILNELAGPRGIRPEEILIGADECGSIAGLALNDSPMLSALSAGAILVSVGPEAGGVPDGVLHLGGSPHRFRKLLAAQAALHPVALPARPELDARWVMIEDGFVLTREHEIESLFAIGNGFVGARGSLAEGSALSAPATFVAGVFDSDPGSVPGLARVPDWTYLSLAANGRPVRHDSGEPLEHRRVLDMRQGMLWRRWRQRDEAGRITRIEEVRLASLADRRLLLQSVAVTPENYSGVLTVEALALSRSLWMQTASGVTVELSCTSRVEDPEGSWTPPPADEREGPVEAWSLDVDLGRTYRLDRLVRVHTSRGPGPPVGAGRDHLPWEDDVHVLVEAHRAAWRARWDASDVLIDGDPEAQRALRFALYHLISAANPEDEHVSIGARALTGPAYKGHVFWDTEIFMLPFFTLTYPEAARALLMYRYHTLPAARARAARLGYRGALYAWESADTGEDVTPSVVAAPTGEVIRILAGEQEHHISADIAYAVSSYWHATADHAFLLKAGAEILFETARFWASRGEYEEDGRYHIRRVIGPDEYHESIDDNAYTNGMAQWNLERAAEIADYVAKAWPEQWRELSARVRMRCDELAEWRRAASSMHLGFDAQTGLFEQFQGYFALEDIDLRAYEPRTAPMDVLLGRERIQQSKIAKQPDVVMLLYLLGDRFPPAVREANFRYYDARTSHGSSLSPSIHAAMAARLGEVALAERYFRQAAEIDLANRMGNAAGGVHAAALGGLWQAVVFGFAGLTLSAEGPRLHPRQPDAWRELRFAVQWRGRRFPADLRQESSP